MDKTIAEIKNYIAKVEDRQREITISIKRLGEEYDSLLPTHNILNELQEIAEKEKEESEDDMK